MPTTEDKFENNMHQISITLLCNLFILWNLLVAGSKYKQQVNESVRL